MIKRLIQKPMFLILLFLIPILSFVISHIENTSNNQSLIGIYFEDDYNEKVLNTITNSSSVITFVKYDNKEQLMLDVQKEILDCAFSFDENIEENILKGKWRSRVDVYTSRNTQLDSIAKEIIASAMFETYSTKTYEKYVENEIGEFAIEFANNSYNDRLNDNSTFSIIYNGETNETNFENENNNTIKINLKGILALLIFIGGLNALLINVDDIETKRFVKFCSNTKLTICNLLSQLSLLSLSVFITLCFIEPINSIWNNFISLFIYMLLVLGYCFAISLVLKTKESVSISIPIFAFLCLICTPIVIDLSTYINAFKIIAKLFPPTYYLILF